jgi:type I restriction enzyme M protein
MNFKIERGDTLRYPAFVDNGRIKKFDVVIANPPYSMKHWGLECWISDHFGRNFAEIPPKNNGDYAWIQHMLISMSANNGRVGVVLPTGVLFRGGTEKTIRKHIIDSDLLDCIIGLGPNLFYGTSLSACILIFKSKKELHKKNNVLFIDASNLYQKGRSQNILLLSHVTTILNLYEKYCNINNFSSVVNITKIRDNDYNLNISIYVEKQRIVQKSINILSGFPMV